MPDFNLGEAIKNAKPSSFTPVPAGSYETTVESAEFSFSKSSGNPMFTLTLVIDEGQDHAGRKLWHRVTFSEKSVDMAVGQMIALGVSQDQLADALSDGGDPSDVCQALVDAHCIAKVIVGEYKGEAKNEVKRITAIPGTANYPTAPEDGAPAPRPAAAGNRPARPF